MKKFILLLVLIMLSSNSFAQKVKSNITSASSAVKPTSQISQVDDFLNLLDSKAIKGSKNNEFDKVVSLIQDVKPSIYLTDNTVKVFGKNPEVMFVDCSSISLLSQKSFDMQNIEMITFKIQSMSDLNSVIDLLSFSDYPKLKYIYIVSSIDIAPSKIINMVKSVSDKYNVFYKIDKGA